MVTRQRPRCAGVEPQTSMLWGKPVQSLFLVLSSPQQKMSGEEKNQRLRPRSRTQPEPTPTRVAPPRLTSDLCTPYLVC